MTDTAPPENWTCVGLTIERSQIKQGATDYQLARRDSDGAFAIVKQVGNVWALHGPVCTLEAAMRTAENVAAGNARALTWPDMPLMLATAMLALFWSAQQTTPTLPGLPGGEPGTPSTDAASDPSEGDRAPSMPAGGAVAAASLDGQSARAAHLSSGAGHAAPPAKVETGFASGGAATPSERDPQRASTCDCGG